MTVVDPEFPVWGRPPHGGSWPPEAVMFLKTVCRNKRTWTLGGVTWARRLDPPMNDIMLIVV